MRKPVAWPDGKRFAFSVFDDTDSATLENVSGVYSFLADCGFRTTKSAWMVDGDPQRGEFVGSTCDDHEYLRWLLDLQSRGFEIGWHNCTWHGLPRPSVQSALQKYADLFGHNPATGTNHTGVEDSIYWGEARLTGWRTSLYNVFTGFRNRGLYRGHIDGDDYFWGDLCREKIKYYRNFVFWDINTLKTCPWMPYHDPLKPYVNYWFASTDGHDVNAYTRCINEANQDRLEAEGGACIMYTHFAKGFWQTGALDAEFRRLMTCLARKNGWFVPVATMLDHLLQVHGGRDITDSQRRRLEWKWLREKIWTGST